MNIPFTSQQFFEVITRYNRDIFPLQILILILGGIAAACLFSGWKARNKWIGGFLGMLWLWTGIAYHLVFFTRINKAAYVFGGLFILQGFWLLYETFVRDRLAFDFRYRAIDWLGAGFIVFGLLIYPILVYLLGHSLQTTISLGLPCPSTILTFGFLLLVSNRFNRWLLVIPALWAAIGTGAAVAFKVYPDFVMPVAALTVLIFVFFKKSRL